MKSALISRRVCSIRQKIRGVNIMGYYIGIDLGTSAVKMLLMDANGDIIKSIAKEYPIYFPQNGWSEQDPQDWWNAVKAGIQEITAFCDKSNIKG